MPVLPLKLVLDVDLFLPQVHVLLKIVLGGDLVSVLPRDVDDRLCIAQADGEQDEARWKAKALEAEGEQEVEEMVVHGFLVDQVDHEMIRCHQVFHLLFEEHRDDHGEEAIAMGVMFLHPLPTKVLQEKLRCLVQEKVVLVVNVPNPL